MIKKIVILKPKKSLNFSESINAGIKASSSKYIFIANDDIIISKNTIEELVKNTTDEVITGPDSNCNLGFQTDYAYTVGGVPLVPSMSLNQIKHIIPEIYNIKTRNSVVAPREWLAFFATMFTRKCIEDIGLMDENFVYDKEDLDYCVRAKHIGKKFHQIFSSYAFHFGGVSRKRKHKELGLKHDLDTEHNTLYFQNKYNYRHDKPVIGIYCHDAWEYWDENSLNSSLSDKPKGIGGSESQAVLISRELAKLGYKVKIFNKCKEQHLDSSGVDVEYVPFNHFEEYSKKIKYDYFIASRYLDCFRVPFKSGRNFAMIHDVFLIMNQSNKQDAKQDKIEKYFALSHAHKNFVSGYHNIPKEQILVTSNGIDLNRFKQPLKRDPYKLIYSSSPDRGLEVLLDMFPKVKAKIPEVTLDIFYGFENFQDQEYVKKMKAKIAATEGVTYHGRVGQDVLAQKFLESSIWAYPTWFEETFCITALEAIAAGTVPVTSHFWGLIDTLKDAGIMLPMPKGRDTVYTKEYQDAWIETTVKLLQDKDYFQKIQDKGYERVKRFTWEAVAKQWDLFFRTGEWKEIQ